MKSFSIPLLPLMFLISLLSSCSQESQIHPVALRTEQRENPLVIDCVYPRLSWINTPSDTTIRGAAQSAYQIIVASDSNLIAGRHGDLWDSGKVGASDSYLVSYAGDSLQEGREYWWTVRVWDGKGKVSQWSETASWCMGISESSWKAKWIGAPWHDEMASDKYTDAPMFSKSFNVDRTKIKDIRAFVTGLGYFELSLNGKKVGDDVLVPNFTNYGPRPNLVKARLPLEDDYSDSRVLYLSYDLMPYLKDGVNNISAIVGNGFYNSHETWVEPYGSPRFLCQIQISYSDGTNQEIVTDESWDVERSHIIMNDVYKGEICDANVKSEPQKAVVRKAPEGRLCAHVSPTDKVIKSLRPMSLKRDSTGIYVADFGEEISGWIALNSLNGKNGNRVTVEYECESPVGSQQYIMDGSGNESYAPKFTWFVFSKARISGVENLTSDNIEAQLVGTDVATDASFSSSNPLLNKIHEIWVRTQTDNMHGGVASDCPHRERSPYTGDGQVACAMVMSNFDCASFYEKWIRDMRDAQHKGSGYVPNGAPWQPGCGGGVAWGAAMNIIPWEHYLNYGDISILADNYPAMKRQTDYMMTWMTPEGTMLQKKTLFGSENPFYWLNLGEWGPSFGLPSEELIHTFYLWMCAGITAKAAKLLGQEPDVELYSSLASNTKKAFHSKFYDGEKKSYGDFGCNVFALTMGVPDSVRNSVKETLRKEISETHNNHLNTGIFGTRYLFQVLSDNGLADLAYAVLNQKDYPSYGEWIECGSSTMWEFWNGEGSHNHPMFGGGLVWMYRGLAGINYDPEKPGFRNIIIKPIVVDGLEYVSYSKQTPYGRVSSSVNNSDGNRSVDVTIPVGATATLYLPSSDDPLSLNQGNYHFTF